jgi:succinate-semialdehyde dehydrogenase / glutarate-semialdehyde dehydrogenase
MTEYAVTDPRTGERISEVPTDSDEQVLAALAAAQDAFTSWGRTSATADRAALVRRVSELHTERREDLAGAMNREMGKAMDDALGEVDFSAAIYGYYADHAEEFLADEEIPVLDGEGRAVVRRRPLGVILGIMPWNYPAYQVARFAGPNLAAGNCVLLKHAPQCPDSARILTEIFRDAGFPEGAYVNIYASNEQIEQLIGDPRIQGVSLTGSERAGSAVAATAGRHLKKVVLELGGSDPFVVLGSDDLDATVDAAVSARMENTGQACNAGKRFIVADELHDDFVAKFNEKMLGQETGPLSSQLAADRLEEQVTKAVAAGAHLESNGERNGAFYPTGVLTGVTEDSEAFHQELFGPVAMVFRAKDEADAVRIANDTPYGLGSYVYSNDPDQAARVADQIDAGMVFVNGVGAEGVEMPFGGVKRSGFGRELGRFGIEEFVNKKLIRTVS